MTQRNFEGMNCSIARALNVVGERWTFLVLRELFNGQCRFDAIQQKLGVASNILTARLQTLVNYGVLERRRYQQHPERFEYHLTDKGLELYPILLALMGWGDRWMCPESKPSVTLIHTACGQITRPMFVCSHCGKPLKLQELRSEPSRP